MKKSIESLFAVAAFAVAALTVHAQSAPKILTVDLEKLYENHYKTQESNAKLKAEQGQDQQKLDSMSKDLNALGSEIKDLKEQSENPTATADAKAKAVSDAQKKIEEYRQKGSERESYYQSVTTQMRQRAQNFHAVMLDEISKSAVEIAKRHGATFLVDRSGPSLVGAPVILYSDPSLDITDEVSAEINKDRPASLPSTDTSAPASAPASPTITLPNISK